jgi:hypothetical protein
MNIKKTKIALTLGGLLFLSIPLSSALVNQKHCKMSATMMSMKSELRGYVTGFKGDDSQVMHQHMNALLLLSEKATNEIPANINAMQVSSKMDHSKMDHGEMNSPEHNMTTMPTMVGMSNEQHHQHMMYMKGMTELNGLFNQLAETQDKDEVKVILGKVKEHSKKNKLFRKNCN